MSADGTDLSENECFAVTTSYGQCEASCPDEKLSNGANWLCYQDARAQSIWECGDDSDDCTYWKKLLGSSGAECKYDATKLCTTLDGESSLKKNADGEALAKATGFCEEPTNSELVDWFFDCDKYPYDNQLSLLEYARCMKEPDCPAEPEAANENADAQAEADAEEDGETAQFTFEQIQLLKDMGFTNEQILALG